jgi:hypothetical protein
MFSSSSSKRSPASSRSQPIFSAVAAHVMLATSARPVAGASRGARLTICASRAARRSSRRPPPPMRNGGCGFCTGFGWPSMSVIV